MGGFLTFAGHSGGRVGEGEANTKLSRDPSALPTHVRPVGRGMSVSRVSD